MAIKSDDHTALNNWGNALSYLAQLRQEPELFGQSFEKYQSALAIKRDKHEVLRNWGSALLNLARLQQEPELFEQCFEKFQSALAIKPDDHAALNKWGVALFELAQLQKKPELLEAAKSKLLQAQSISNQPSYNLACLYSLMRDELNCREELLSCYRARNLPDQNHLNNDTDLDFVSDKVWFRELIDTL
ncbi:conserved hypothetical protein [Vibrio nigripulchritudo SFn118]|nr:conserved hypothetical protein [Vibrio nigripulchritudo SFn118]